MDYDLISFLAVILFTLFAVVSDLRTRRIPNWLTVSAFAAGLVYHIATGGLEGLLFSLGGFATGFGTLLILWLMGGGGGGDVKLMGAVGAWLGAFSTILVFIGSALFAIVCTLAVLIHNRNTPQQASTSGAANGAAQVSVLKQTIPYALPVTMAIWTLFFYCIFQN